MSAVSTNNVLNRLLGLHARSLPMYLADAAPYARPGNDRAREVLAHIVADIRLTVDRLGEELADRGGNLDTGHFPLHFTAYNDISYDYLLAKLIAHQEKDIAAIRKCVDDLALVPMTKALAEECLGAALGHLDSLQELASPMTAVAAHATV